MRSRVLGAVSQPTVAARARRDTEAPGQLRLVRRAIAVYAPASAAGLSSLLPCGLCPAGTAITARRAVHDDHSSNRDRNRQVAKESASATPCRGRGARGATASAAWRRIEHRGVPPSIGRGGDGKRVIGVSGDSRFAGHHTEWSRQPHPSSCCQTWKHLRIPAIAAVRALNLPMGDG